MCSVRSGKAGGSRLGVVAGRHGTHELAIERILDVEQRGRDLLERALIGRLAVRDDGGEILSLALDLAARFVEAENAERVADFLQHVELRAQLVGALHARAHEDVERVFDRAEQSPLFNLSAQRRRESKEQQND